MQKPHISIVIPVYKAASCLHELYRRLRESTEICTRNFEIILIEDCGGDSSWEIIQQLAKQDPRVKGMQFSRNFGQHYGITAGLDQAQGDWVIVMDCDLQDRPEEIPRLYAKALEGHELVLARRTQRVDSLIKRLTSKAFYRLFSYLTDLPYDGSVGNFRIMSHKVVLAFRTMREQLRFFGGLVQWTGFSPTFIEVTHAERHEGQSSYTFGKLFRLASDTIIAFSDKPLKMVVNFGFLMSFISFVFGAAIFLRALLHGTSVTGWSSLIVSLYFLSGIIIMILGVIGVYLGKAFDQMKNRPLYIVNRTTFPLTPHD
ncbi:MAG TPA: glycosyltransferase [Hydrogenophaga sp.]|uniref:glycosyltransferase family 2 protein n=1 Tax=Hydrogenophaga sp. TaxID=1904254 RepID=UPI0008C46B6C|nr:glycosyltransferase family 2 protein [Hydrogenophaga sp.]OGA76569.1 MAG: glycosyltransferase [Burkholderiales bacterium GWE1_65_30]OGA91485.1 MAG: glycosyltransferase [Burkholderiales bacterium GWF1_66_17]HAX19784.1 glycosyltransferase [Hydrogenophaga sp.]HBU20158.1 glycosyltransferase [Hydrogenophaga sp.]